MLPAAPAAVGWIPVMVVAAANPCWYAGDDTVVGSCLLCWTASASAAFAFTRILRFCSSTISRVAKTAFVACATDWETNVTVDMLGLRPVGDAAGYWWRMLQLRPGTARAGRY